MARVLKICGDGLAIEFNGCRRVCSWFLSLEVRNKLKLSPKFITAWCFELAFHSHPTVHTASFFYLNKKERKEERRGQFRPLPFHCVASLFCSTPIYPVCMISVE